MPQHNVKASLVTQGLTACDMRFFVSFRWCRCHGVSLSPNIVLLTNGQIRFWCDTPLLWGSCPFKHHILPTNA